MELTPASLKKLCKERKQYISSPELNDVLHLQCKGITRLENLQAYTGLKTLYLEQNAISVIEGLELLVNLRCLYLGKNIITTIGDGLSLLTALETLDLSENCISAISGIDTLQQLKTLNISGNRLRSTADLSALSVLGCTLTTLDLASNKIDDPAVIDLLTAIPLSLLRLNGNPVVSNIRHYRKVMLTRFPTLNYLDESPCFPNDRRLAAAFVEGGLDVERAERDTIRKEEEALREKHRQAFDDMVAAARANPPLPHDPMRFRAVPPGESDSSDEEGLPLSARHAKVQRRQQRQLVQQARRASTSSSTPSASQILSPASDLPTAATSTQSPGPEDTANTADIVQSLQAPDGTPGITSPASNSTSNVTDAPQAISGSQVSELQAAVAAPIAAGTDQPVSSEPPLPLRAQSLVQFGPPQARPLRVQPPAAESCIEANHQSAGAATPALQQEDFCSELRDRAMARAAARAEATATSDGENNVHGRFSHTYRQQQQHRAGDSNGGPHTSDGIATEIDTEDGMSRTIAGPEGRFAPFVIPRVWGTPNYRRLWEMAVAAGEGQQLQQEEEERNSRELVGDQAGTAEDEVRGGSEDSVLQNGGGSSSDSDSPQQDIPAAGGGYEMPLSSVGDAASIGDSAMNWVPAAGGGSVNASLDRTDLDSARDGNSSGSPVRHLGVLVPAEDLDSARGVERTDEDLDSAHSFHGLDQENSTSSTPLSAEGMDGLFEDDAMEVASMDYPEGLDGMQQCLGIDALLSNGHVHSPEERVRLAFGRRANSGGLDTSDGDEMEDEEDEGDRRAAAGRGERRWSQSQQEVEEEEVEVDLFARYSIMSVGRGGATMPASIITTTPQPALNVSNTTSANTQPSPPTTRPAPIPLQRSGSGELSASLLTSQSQRLHALYSIPLSDAVPASSSTSAASASISSSRAPPPSGSVPISAISAMAALLRTSASQLPIPAPADDETDSPWQAVADRLNHVSTVVDSSSTSAAAGTQQDSSLTTTVTGTSGDVISPRHATMMGRNSRLVSTMSDSARVIHPPAAWETEVQEAEVFDDSDLETAQELQAQTLLEPSPALSSDGEGVLFVVDAGIVPVSGHVVGSSLEAIQRLNAQRAQSTEGYARSDSAWVNEQQRLQSDVPHSVAESTPTGPWFTSSPSVGQESNLLEQARALVGTASGSMSLMPGLLSSARGSTGLPNDAYLQLAETMQAPEVLAQARAIMSSPNSRSTSIAQLSGNLDSYRSSIYQTHTSGPICIPQVAESDETAGTSADGQEQQLSLLEQARLILRSPLAAPSPFFNNPRLSVSIQEDREDTTGSPNWAHASLRERGSHDRSSPRASPGQGGGGSGLRMRVNSLSVVDFDEPSPMSGAVSSFSCPDSSINEAVGSGRPGSLLSAARALVRGEITHATARVSSPMMAAASGSRSGDCDAPSIYRVGSLGRAQLCGSRRDSAEEVTGGALRLSDGQQTAPSVGVVLHREQDVSTLFELD